MQQTRQEWLAQRRTGIGGSDVAPILGMSKWTTPLQVYEDKIGIGQEQEDNPAMKWGRIHEPSIRQEYAETTGRTVYVPDGIIAHPKYPFMLASIDGITDDDRVFEAKTARSADGWGEPGSADVPEAYALQVQHYLAVTGKQIADVAVLIGGSDFRIYTLEADKDLQEMLYEAESQFWSRVLARNPPEATTLSDSVRAFGRSESQGLVQASSQAVGAWAELKRVREMLAELEAAEEACKAIITKEIGNLGDTLVEGGAVLATWKLAKGRSSFDTKALQQAYPQIYAAFVSEGQPSRRLLIK